MTIRLNDKYLKNFVTEEDYANIAPKIEAAHKTLVNKSGAGNDFLGWVTLPSEIDDNLINSCNEIV